ncbi:hypothetical protein Clim_1475 [Chlorobium limicola DSM 245]|uniref:Uncharacterized protein n=1 Tax=Chlorobium limicola (strain DSM 245 / NBRC 103803 / 6330) TaxID=290315 RepID=B3EDA6_CHLL2|nr:hypothetical protein Clim_1475 [Chlorobium limicola DSM 245]
MGAVLVVLLVVLRVLAGMVLPVPVMPGRMLLSIGL